MAATIKMVAQLAGVSVATVSKYLNGGNVIEENRVRVQNAVDELNYSINEVARSLKMSRTFTVGVLAASIESTFITSIISAIQYALLEKGYSTIIVDYQMNKSLEQQQVDVLLQRQVDGIILFPEENETELLSMVRAKKIPIVVIDNMLENAQCDAVLTNNRSAAYAATEALIRNNHNRIGILAGPRSMYTGRERLRGYCDALAAYDMPQNDDLIANGGYYNIEDGYKSAKKLLELPNPPTAILGTNYYMTIGALKAIRQCHLKVPRDISYITFDELEFSCVLRTEISAVVQPLQKMGQTAAQLIVRRIEGHNEDFPSIIELEGTIKLTDSIRKL